jgi:alpha-glucosidase
MVNAHEALSMVCVDISNLSAMNRPWSEFEAFGGSKHSSTVLPFTRLIGGPWIIHGILNGYFELNPENNSHVNSSSYQWHFMIQCYSALQMAAALPVNYIRFMVALQFIKDVAIDWDDTRVLEAEPGDYITYARKAKGSNNWFVGATVDENGYQSNIAFDFLDADKQYIATIYADAPMHIIATTRRLTKSARCWSTASRS